MSSSIVQKSVTFIFILLLFPFLAASQSRSLSANLANSSYYKAGVVQTFDLSLTLQSQDNEFCDSLAIAFPAGTQIMHAPNQFSYNQGSQQPAELLSLASLGTNILSYGDNDNIKGGIETGTYHFQIEVLFPSNLVGQQKLHWYFSGDESGNSPHEFFDSTFVSQLPAQPDLSIETALQYPYSAVPEIAFDSIRLVAQIENKGSAYSASNQILVNHLEQSNLVSETFAFNLNFQENERYTFSEPFDVNQGIQTFRAQLFENTDFDLANNRDTLQIEITDTVYAVTFPIDLAPLPDYIEVDAIGQIMSFPEDDTLTSLTVHLLSPVQGDALSVEVFEWTNGSVGSFLFRSNEITIPTSFPGFYNFKLPNLAFASDDSFLVALDLTQATNSQPAMGKASFLQPSDRFFIHNEWVTTDSLFISSHLNVLYNVGDVAPYCESIFDYTYQGDLEILFESNTTPFTYNWSVNGLIAGVGNTFLFEFPTEGIYEVCLQTIDSACTSTYCEQVNVQFNSTTESKLNHGINFFPNPASQQITIECIPGYQADRLEIFNATGKKVCEKSIDTQQTTCDISALSPGVYFFKIFSEGAPVYKRDFSFTIIR